MSVLLGASILLTGLAYLLARRVQRMIGDRRSKSRSTRAMEKLNQSIQLVRRADLPAALICICVETDTPATSAALRGLHDLITGALRITDVAVVEPMRASGVIVVCPNTTLAAARKAVERLDLVLRPRGHVVSFGVACFPGDGFTFEVLRKIAQQRAEAMQSDDGVDSWLPVSASL